MHWDEDVIATAKMHGITLGGSVCIHHFQDECRIESPEELYHLGGIGEF
jgi:hypothetical protein